MNLNRRRLLALTGTMAAASVAGCSGGDGGDGSSDDGGSTDDGSGQSTDDSSDPSDGTENSDNEQDDSSSGSDDGSSSGGSDTDGGNIQEDPVEFDNYTRDAFLVEVHDDKCNDTLEFGNWTERNNQIGFVMSVIGQKDCQVVSRGNEAYDEENNHLTLELEFSAAEGATGCGGDCRVQHDIITAYEFPHEVVDDVSIDVYVARNGNEPELRTSWPVQN